MKSAQCGFTADLECRNLLPNNPEEAAMVPVEDQLGVYEL